MARCILPADVCTSGLVPLQLAKQNIRNSDGKLSVKSGIFSRTVKTGLGTDRNSDDKLGFCSAFESLQTWKDDVDVMPEELFSKKPAVLATRDSIRS